MPSGLQALLALFLLLPGFVSARLSGILNARSQQSDLQRVVQALIHSFAIYVIYLGVFGSALPIEWSPSPEADGASHFAIHIFRLRIAALGLLSLVLGIGWGYAKSRDWPMQWLRKKKFTERTLRESVWNDVFVTQAGRVQVGLGDGRSALGRLSRYSDTGEEGSVFLSNASWIAQDSSLIPIPGPGLLLTKAADIRFVMFLDNPEQIAQMDMTKAEV